VQPSCRISPAKARHGHTLRVRCTGVTGKLALRVTRRGKRVRRITARIDGSGRARFSNRGLRRGRYKVTLTQNDRRLAARTIRVR
jgi:hypothetical protein